MIFPVWLSMVYHSFMISMMIFHDDPENVSLSTATAPLRGAAWHLLLQSHLHSFPRFDVIRQHHFVLLAVVPWSIGPGSEPKMIEGKSIGKTPCLMDLESRDDVPPCFPIISPWYPMILRKRNMEVPYVLSHLLAFHTKVLHDQTITRRKVGRHDEFDADECIFLPKCSLMHPKNCSEWKSVIVIYQYV